jgi:hypothetical protein
MQVSHADYINAWRELTGSMGQVNKQLNDKERVAAALENSHLLGVVEQCLSNAHQRGSYA